MSADPYNSLLDEMERKAAPRQPRAPKPAGNRYGAYEAQTEGDWSIAHAATVKDWFKQTYGRDLPVTAEGQGRTHNRMGLDHSDSLDVGLNPTTPEGRALVSFLKQNKFPYLAYDRAVPGGATGPHVHVGYPSHKGRPGANPHDPYQAMLAQLEKQSPAPTPSPREEAVGALPTTPAGPQSPATPERPPQLLEPGNIDLAKRPVARNADGTISTVRSMSVNIDGREVLIPTVSDDGKILTDEQAVELYRRTGRHLGVFDSPDAATAYAKSLHERQAEMYGDQAEAATPGAHRTGLTGEQRAMEAVSTQTGQMGRRGGVVTIGDEEGLTAADIALRAYRDLGARRGLDPDEADSYAREVVAQMPRELLANAELARSEGRTDFDLRSPGAEGLLNKRLAEKYGERVLGGSVRQGPKVSPVTRAVEDAFDSDKARAFGYRGTPQGVAGVERGLYTAGGTLARAGEKMYSLLDAATLGQWGMGERADALRNNAQYWYDSIADLDTAHPTTLMDKLVGEAVTMPIPLAKAKAAGALLESAAARAGAKATPEAVAALLGIFDTDPRADPATAVRQVVEMGLLGKSTQYTLGLGKGGHVAAQGALGAGQGALDEGTAEGAIRGAVNQAAFALADPTHEAVRARESQGPAFRDPLSIAQELRRRSAGEKAAADRQESAPAPAPREPSAAQMMSDGDLAARIEQLAARPAKGTRQARREARQRELDALLDEAAARFARTAPRPPAEHAPTGTPTFKEFVEEMQPRGGIRFETLEPSEPLYAELKGEYDRRYGSQNVLGGGRDEGKEAAEARQGRGDVGAGARREGGGAPGRGTGRVREGAEVAVPPVPAGHTRFYRADIAEATAPRGGGWSTDAEYVSQKYGAGAMGAETIWYRDIPDRVFTEAGDAVPTLTRDDALKVYGVTEESAPPKLFRRSDTAGEAAADNQATAGVRGDIASPAFDGQGASAPEPVTHHSQLQPRAGDGTFKEGKFEVGDSYRRKADGRVMALRGADAQNVHLGVRGDDSGPTVAVPRAAFEDGYERTEHKYSSTQVDLPEREAQEVRALGRKLIPDSSLYADPKDGSMGREADPHVTVKYGLHTEDAAEVGRLLADEPPVTVRLGKVSLFTAKGDSPYDVVKVDVDSPDLHRLNKKIEDALEVTDTHPEYKPHVTLAYVRKGEGAKFEGDASLEGRTITLDKLTFSSSNGEQVEIPLRGEKRGGVAEEATRATRAGQVRPTEGTGAVEEVAGKEAEGAAGAAAKGPGPVALRDNFKRDMVERFKLPERQAEAVATVADALDEGLVKWGLPRGSLFGGVKVERGGRPEGVELNQSERAATSFLKDGTAVIRALDSPDVSSGAHEVHHTFTPRLAEATLKTPDATLRETGEAFFRWLGFKDADDFTALHRRFVDGTLEGRARARYVEGQEKGSRGFERYLKTGEAPSVQLRRVFEDFKAWLTKIYGAIRGKDHPLNVKLSDEAIRAWDTVLGAPKGEYGQLVHQLHKAPAEGVPAFFENAQVKGALGLAADASAAEVRAALASAAGRPRSSHLSPEDVRAWARGKDLGEAAGQALDFAAGKYRESVKAPTAYQQTGIRKRNVNPETQSLSEFVRAMGGIRVDRDGANRGELESLTNKESGSSGLVRRGGMSVYDMAHAAAEAGYPVGSEGGYVRRDLLDQNAGAEEASADTLVELLTRDLGGDKVYSNQREVDYEELYRQENPEDSADALISLIETERGGILFDKVQDGTATRGEIAEFRRLAEEEFGVFPEHVRAVLRDAKEKAAAGVQAPARSEGATDFNFGGDDSLADTSDILFQAATPQTHTPEFRNWFKDSKVVDATGEPLAVHHGTDKDYTEFDPDAPARHPLSPDLTDNEIGIFFTSSPEVAGAFAGRDGGANVMPTYLSIRRPLELGHFGSRSAPPADGMRELLRGIRANGGARAWREHLIGQGVDGFILRNTREGAGGTQPFGLLKDFNSQGTVYIPFHPEQVKSATGNRGTFDPSNPNILFQSDHAAATRRQRAYRALLEAKGQGSLAPDMRANPRTRTTRGAGRSDGPNQPALSDDFTPAQKKTPWYDALTAFRRANLLSAPKTHARNVASNAVFQLSEEASKPFAVLADALVGRKSGRRTVAAPSVVSVARASKDAIVRGVPEALNVIRHGSARPSAQQLDEIRSSSRILDAYINTTFRTLEAEDRVFKTYAVRRSLEEQAKVQALNEKRSNSALNVSARQKQLLTNPTPAMQAEAAAYAEFATFQNKNKISDTVAELKRKSEAGKFLFEQLVPFDKTPTNIVLRVLDFSPAGLAKAGIQYGRARKRAAQNVASFMSPAEQKAFSQTFGRGSLGTGVFVLGALLASKGLMSGDVSYEDDRKAYSERRRLGILPGSLRIGSARVVVSGNPLGNVLKLGATVYEQAARPVSDEVKSEGREADVRLTRGAKAAFGAVSDQPLLRAASDLDSGKTLGQRAGEFASGYVPLSAVVNELGEIIDPKQRQGRGFVRSMQRRVPLVRESLPEQENPLGGPDGKGGLGRRAVRALDPFQVTTRAGEESRGGSVNTKDLNLDDIFGGSRRKRRRATR